MATDLERLVVSLEANLTRLQRQMGSAGPIVDRATRDAADKASRNLKAMEDRADKAAANINRSLGRFGRDSRGGLQNTALQLQDVIVQLQAGTAATTIFAQQGSQILGAFGPWGAILGVAAAGVGALASQLGIFGEKTVSAKEASDQFATAIDATNGLLSDQQKAFVENLTRLSLYQQGFEDLSTGMLEAATRANQSARAGLAGQIDGAESAIGALLEEGTGLNTLIQNLAAEMQTLADAGQAIPPGMSTALQALVDFRDNTNPTITDVSALWDVLGRVKDLMPQFGGAVDDVKDRVTKTVPEFKKLSDENRALQIASDAAGGSLDTTAVNTGKAGDAAATATPKVRGLAGAFLELSRAQMVDTKTPKAGLSFGGKTVGFGSNPLTQALSDLAGEGGGPGSDSGFKIPNRPGGGGRGGASKRTTADKADDRLESLQNEIDLNTKLLAAYALGEEAMAKIKAQYDAVNAARQAGLKETDQEYSSYIERYQAAETENAALEAKLKLMAQGKSLTAEMQTEQEKLNAKLVEYKALLDAGAIGQTTYERAVAKAKDQNDALGESISAVGDAITTGIQGATSFSDALLKIGVQLLNLLSKGLFGQGPLGGLFNSLFGVAAGGLLGSAVGGSGGTPSAGLGTGYRRSFAAGGMAGPGNVLVGENGPEVLSLSRRGHVTPANATRRLMGGGGGNNGPLQIVVSGARGNAEIQAMVAAGVAQGVKVARSNVGKDYDNYRVRFGS